VPSLRRRACARVCPVNAIVHGADAIVLDEKSCIGCKMCALACPFGAITPSGTTTAGVAGIKANTPNHSEALGPLLVWEIGVRSVAVKCDLCTFRSEGPICIQVCPTKALFSVDQGVLQRTNGIKRQTELAWQGTGLSPRVIEEQE
jgi:hydrogenase-4 component A